MIDIVEDLWSTLFLYFLVFVWYFFALFFDCFADFLVFYEFLVLWCKVNLQVFVLILTAPQSWGGYSWNFFLCCLWYCHFVCFRCCIFSGLVWYPLTFNFFGLFKFFFLVWVINDISLFLYFECNRLIIVLWEPMTLECKPTVFFLHFLFARFDSLELSL